MNDLKPTLLAVRRHIRIVLGMWLRRWRAPKLPLPKTGEVLVNLGCGPSAHPDFINIDTRPFRHVHYIHSIAELPMFPNNSVDLLYASHVLEHIDREVLPIVLSEWRRALKPGGILRIGVPNFDNLINIYIASGRNIDSIVNQLLGQGAPHADHHSIWNMPFAKRLLEGCGFSDVRTWDPEEETRYAIRDKTTRTALIGNTTIPLSLNIEATKK